MSSFVLLSPFHFRDKYAGCSTHGPRGMGGWQQLDSCRPHSSELGAQRGLEGPEAKGGGERGRTRSTSDMTCERMSCRRNGCLSTEPGWVCLGTQAGDSG
eukprot:416700-Rhodomonas_salina.1